jgi:hypothetical protein
MRSKGMIASAVLAIAAVTAPAGAGEHADMMTQFMNCDVCKNLAVHMEELGPVMKHEFIALNDGVAMHHWITDPAKVALYHEASAKMTEAGNACMSYTEEQVKQKLCACCQGIHALMAAGAEMSLGQSADGDLMVLTADDPAVQTSIAEWSAKMQQMMGSMGS